MNALLAVEGEQTLGEYAHALIRSQYRRIVKQEKKVLADRDPEPLHQVRVSLRRLRVALQIFDLAVELPKPSRVKHLRHLASVLGKLRDLDVQIAALRDHYRPQLTEAEQLWLDRALSALSERRRRAFAAAEYALTQPRYQKLKEGYETWLNQPQCESVAQLPLLPLIPDLLSPLLSKLLLHPGWLVPVDSDLRTQGPVLHNLRKTIKQVRYQAEFFTDFYGQVFQQWLDTLEELQDRLGTVQDTQVLLKLLAHELPDQVELPGLKVAIEQQQAEALSNWGDVRQQYLAWDFRRSLHQMLLDPTWPAEAAAQSPQATDSAATSGDDSEGSEPDALAAAELPAPSPVPPPKASPSGGKSRARRTP